MATASRPEKFPHAPRLLLTFDALVGIGALILTGRFTRLAAQFSWLERFAL